MTRSEFDHWLRYRLSDLPRQEVDRISVFYQDAISDRMEDGMTEEEAIHALGEPEALLEDIRASLYVFEEYEEAQRRTERSKKRRLTPVGIAALCCVIAVLGVVVPAIVFNLSVGHSEPVYSYPDEVPIVDLPAGEAFAEHRFSLDELDKIAVAVETAPIVVAPSYDVYVHVYASSCYTVIPREGCLYVEDAYAYDGYADNTIRLEIPADRWDYYLTIKCDVGDVEVHEIVPTGLQVGLETGNIYLNYVSALESIEVRTGAGMISGLLQGAATDYRVEASVGTGVNNLGNTHTGHIRLWASAETGDIDVYFAE